MSNLKERLHEFDLLLRQQERMSKLGSSLVNEAREQIDELERALRDLVEEVGPLVHQTGKGWQAYGRAAKLVEKMRPERSVDEMREEVVLRPKPPVDLNVSTPPARRTKRAVTDPVEDEWTCRCSRLSYPHRRSTSSGCPRF